MLQIVYMAVCSIPYHILEQRMAIMTIKLYSHFFTIGNITPDSIGLILRFSTRYIHRTFVSAQGKMTLKPTRVFGCRIGTSEFRFHIGQLKDFMSYMANQGIDKSLMDMQEVSLYEPTTMLAKVNPKFEEREYQRDIIEFLTTTEIDDNRSRLVGLQTGGGKALPLNTRVKVPSGWKAISDLKVDDEVTAWDGTTTRVTGVYPQGVRKTAKITFSDGRTSVCDMDHLWRVYSNKWITDNGWKVLSTKEILKTEAYELGSVYIPLCASEDVEDVHLVMELHRLGTIIGNGQQKDPNDPMMEGPIAILKDLYLLTDGCTDGYIPDAYLHGSTDQRLALIRGILDEAGYVDNASNITYYTASEKLAKTVQYLIRSIGGISEITSDKPFYTHKRECLTYTVSIKYRKPSELFESPLKKRRAGHNDLRHSALKLHIEKIEPNGEEECVCIAIKHPDKLYIIDDFVVTHNTFVSLSASARLGYRTMILVLPKYIEKWGGDVVDVLEVPTDDTLIIRGGKDLRSLLYMSEDPSLSFKFVIISLSTLQTYYNEFNRHGTDIIDQGYACVPEDMCKRLGIGTVIFDEVHQHLYSVYRALIHLHVPKVIALSGTLLSDDVFISDMQAVMFPKEIRYNNLPINKYVKIHAYSYGFINQADARKVKTTGRGSGNYSHIQFEQSITKHKGLLSNYMDLILYIVELEYIKQKVEGDRCLVFAASIDMCTRITNMLAAKYPKLSVKRYVEDDPYENVIESDIRVSTIQSAGTAIDIPNLTRVLLTNSIKSTVSNLQALGRLRKLKDKEVVFSYMYNYHIPKQVQYHRAKKELFYERSVSYKDYRLETGI